MEEAVRANGYQSIWHKTVLIVPILLLALGIRLHEMNGRSLWLDEAVEFNVAAHPLSEIIASDQASTHDPPLFSLLLGVWMQLGREDFFVRFLPVFTSILTVVCVFVLGNRIFSLPVGWFSALLMAVAPRSVYYGLELNQYAFVLLFAPLGALLLERYLQRSTPGRLCAFIAMTILAILTHYALAIYMAALAVIGTLSQVFNRDLSNRRRTLIAWLAGLGVVAAIGLVLLFGYAMPQKARLSEAAVPVRFEDHRLVLQEVENWLVQTNESIRILLWGFDRPVYTWITATLLIFGTIAGLLRASSRRLALYFVVSLMFAYVMEGIGFFVYYYRNISYVLPLGVLLLSGSVFFIADNRFKRYLTPIAYLMMIMLAVLLARELPMISHEPFPETEQFGDVMQYFEIRYRPSDAVYVYYGAVPAFQRYADDNVLKAATLQPWSRGVSLEKQQAGLWTAVGDASRVWLLMSHVDPSDASILPDALKSRCRQIDVIEAIKSAGYLFECAKPSF